MSFFYGHVKAIANVLQALDITNRDGDGFLVDLALQHEVYMSRESTMTAATPNSAERSGTS
jgi:hypothetical protein